MTQKSFPRRLQQRLIDVYLTIDPRSLGLFRILFGILLLIDLIRRIPGISDWYSNEGLLPNYTMLEHPVGSSNIFSFFLMASTPAEAKVGFLLCGIVFACFLIGWKTRLFHTLTLLCLVSLHSRNTLIENAGDSVSNILCVWTLFLPLGRSFSVDSLIDSFNSEKAPNPPPVVSLAVFAVLLQFAVIYFFECIHKDGLAWKEGTVIHYILRLEGIVTWFGIMVREHFPLWLSKIMTWMTLVIEGIAPFLLLTPIGYSWARRIAILLLPPLHLGFALFLNVGLLSPFMMVFYILLLSKKDWEFFVRFFRRKSLCQEMSRLCNYLRQTAFSAMGRSSRVGASTSNKAWRPSLILSEFAVLMLMAVLGADVLNSNRAVHPRLRFEPPECFQAVVDYLRLGQSWAVYSPGVPLYVRLVVVDAVTIDGRHIDPYNLAGSGIEKPFIDSAPVGYGQNQFWFDYTHWIFRGYESPYYEPLKEWILNHHLRTGNPNDEIVSFEAYWNLYLSPKPGERNHTLAQQVKFLSHLNN